MRKRKDLARNCTELACGWHVLIIKTAKPLLHVCVCVCVRDCVFVCVPMCVCDIVFLYSVCPYLSVRLCECVCLCVIVSPCESVSCVCVLSSVILTPPHRLGTSITPQAHSTCCNTFLKNNVTIFKEISKKLTTISALISRFVKVRDTDSCPYL